MANHARPIAPFLILVFATTWLFQLPFVLATRGAPIGPKEWYAPLVALGFFAPMLFAFALSRGQPGGIGSLLAPFRFRGAGACWYVLALLHGPALYLAARAVFMMLGGNGIRWFYAPASAVNVAAMAVVPFLEQIPWRGFAYPRLAARLGPAKGSLVTGLSWGLFHAQKHIFLGPAAPWETLKTSGPLVVLMTAGTVVYTWLQGRAKGSALIVVVAQAGLYLNNPAYAAGSTQTPLILLAAAYVVAAAVLLADRDRRPPRQAPH